MRYYHHDHHGDSGSSSVDLSESEKALMLAKHMLEHNRHHEEEMASLAARFEAAGQPAAAGKIRSARARLVEADLALMEAIETSSTTGCAGGPPSPEGKA